MTDSELIKALENKVQGSDYACFEDYEILDLIKRQKAELEAIKDKRAMVFKLSEEQINEVNENKNPTKQFSVTEAVNSYGTEDVVSEGVKDKVKEWIAGNPEERKDKEVEKLIDDFREQCKTTT